MDQGFPKKEKLKSKKLIDQLFTEGTSVKAFPLQLVYLKTPLPYDDITIQAGVSVPKRLYKKAVTRNRIKRLLREAYRTQKSLMDTKGTTFVVLIIYSSRDIPSFEVVNKAMTKLLNRFTYEISHTNS